jgi:hypothetical protein
MPRKEDRYTFLKEVELEFASGKRMARISDISKGGCYVDSIASVPVGEPLSLSIAGPGGIPMRLSGKVAYILDGFGFGVEFTDLTPEGRDFLLMLIGAQQS